MPLAQAEGGTQAFTGAMIQIDQSTDPTKVTVAGEAHSLQTAVDMVKVSLPRTSARAWRVACLAGSCGAALRPSEG